MAAEIANLHVAVAARQKRRVPSPEKRFRERLVPVAAHGKHHLRDTFRADILREALRRIRDAEHLADRRHHDALVDIHALDGARLHGLLRKCARNRLRVLRFPEELSRTRQGGRERGEFVSERGTVHCRVRPLGHLPCVVDVAAHESISLRRPDVPGSTVKGRMIFL